MLASGVKLISDMLDATRRRIELIRTGQNPFLVGNYAPVSVEFSPTPVKILSGVVPADLPPGVFLRNGPNPKYQISGLYHWFDGDGMVHSVALNMPESDQPIYTNHQIRTKKLAHEDKVGGSDYLNVGDLKGPLGLVKMGLYHARSKLGDADLKDLLTLGSGGAANTSLVYHAGKLLALVESSLPTELRMTTALPGIRVETSGPYNFANRLRHPFTAHPKICPCTGEMMFFGYSVTGESPNCSYTVVDPQGNLVRTVDIGLKRKIMMHDFAITRNFSLFLDLPLCFSPDNMAKSLNGGAFKFKGKAGARIGVMPRHGESKEEVTWIDIEPCSVFHTVNAYEEIGDDGSTLVVLQACRFPKIDLFSMSDGRAERKYDSDLYEWRLNLTKGRIEHEGPLLSGTQIVGDFPQINGKMLGTSHRYVWVSTFSSENNAKFDGVVKVDVQTREVTGYIKYGGSCRRGGEVQFVQKQGAKSEDDGYLLGFVHDETSDQSTLWVMDAQSMDSTPLAVVELPGRVPFGFHGLWVPLSSIIDDSCNQESSDGDGISNHINIRSSL